ncbi:DUF445 domain-containing protein [Thermaurantiacus tibetensis]|uniref:DUF445 domain-containing protein n=1 Tax=Thermaurantiacus tibetensis TaxID=2759035 RepID=UPI00188E3F69|nr:DUF445 domain-containing protein [Thermaurantiacus tibetensis]
MAIVLAASTWAMQAIHPGFAWVQAFAEAALVGGLADWFAVTALFRHPLGLPIPHTAIIPASKDRIGNALAAFLRDNFLTPRIVARRLERFDAAGLLGRFLAEGATGPGDGAARVRQGLVGLVRQLADTPAADALGERVKAGVLRRLRALDAAPLLAGTLEAALAEGRHHPVIDSLVAWASRTLDAEEPALRAMIEERTNWLLRLIAVDERVANEILAGLRGFLAEVAADPEHPVRRRADLALETFIFDLRHLPETQAKVERWKQALIDNPAVGQWVEGLWEQARAAIGRFAEGDGAGDLARRIGTALREDRALASAVNSLARRAVVGLVRDHGDAIVALVSDTVKGWDTATITAKLESAVGRDLQYIRLNGTLIGGSIGVLLHAIFVAVGAH